jgi:hypothetical protein
VGEGRHVHHPPQSGHLVEVARGRRLLDVLEPVSGELLDDRSRRGRAPGLVGVDADPRVLADGLAD